MRTFRAIAGVLLFPLHSLAVAASTDGAQLRSAVAGVGVPFVENLGQAHPDVRFTAQTFAGTLFVSRQGELVLSLPDGAAPREPVLLRESVRAGKVRGVRGLERSGARVSFFLGNDPRSALDPTGGCAPPSSDLLP